MKMKLRMHLKFCSNPPKGFDKIGIPRKACMMREQQLNEAERTRLVHNKYLSSWINITIPECNQEATLYLQELTSTLLIQKLIQVHLAGNTSHDYQSFPQFLSICRFPLTISYQLLFTVGHRVLHQVVICNDTIHLRAMHLLVDRPLI